MTQAEQILQQLANIQAWINSVNANSKLIHQLDLAESLEGGNFLPISNGVDSFKITVSTLVQFVNNAVKLKEHAYNDIPEMLADQSAQTLGKVQYVEDASADPNVPSGYAYYEKLDSSTATLAADYRKLSAEEAEVIATLDSINLFEVKEKGTTVSTACNAGQILVEFENVGNKVTNIIFGPIFSSYLAAFDALGLAYVLKLFNTTTNKALIAKITNIEYSDGTNTFYKLTVLNTMDATALDIGNKVFAEISVYDAAVAGLSSLSGDGVDNTDPNNPVMDLSAYQAVSEKGQADGYASLDSGGKVPAAQLPSFVDDTIEGYLDSGTFYEEAAHTNAITPASGVVYVDLHTNKSYRWTGSLYTRIDDISATEVETLYESRPNTNKFEDAEKTKLGGIEAGAQVNTINSQTAGEPTGSDQVNNVVSLTQAEYDAGTPVATTMYLITDA